MLRIRIRRILIFLGLPDPHPDPSVKDMDPDPSIIKHRGKCRFWFPWTWLCSVGDPWHFGADLDPAPTPDPTPFFSDFNNAKKIFFSYFFSFSYSLPAGTLSSVLKIKYFAKFCVKILFCKHYFSLLNTFMRKKKGSIPLTNGSGSGRPKTCGSWSWSGSPTLPMLCFGQHSGYRNIHLHLHQNTTSYVT